MEKSFQEILTDERANRGLTQREMADMLGISEKMYSFYENGKYEGGKTKVSKYLNILYGNKKKVSNEEGSNPPNLIPYYPDLNASAGLSMLTDNTSMRVEMINIPNVDAQCFINVFGDSMYPKFCSGEIIGIKEVEKDYVMFGQAYVIQMKNGEAYLKYIKAGRDENHWFLANENKHYEPKEFHIDKIEKLYIIKAVITKTTL